MWFDRINRFYSQGLWTKEMVADGVRVNVLTETKYKEITGEEYNA
ncbi:XkdX family protein [Sutcliffiella rhizosphaerae]|uniref:XkdX family protein n=1 Tax=Sutcliffiella rhizosphaerae TaxID=2880967 RepID=A0ABM8YLP8_9BACI|nr:hypothetical protein BACCIP111883_01656 [Sutcliffiella rhizosphaerae]